MDFKIEMFCCMYRGCDKEYLSRQNLKRHINISHLLKKQSKCNICQKLFKNSTNLKEHNFIHTDSKPYKCEVCHMRFRHKAKLGTHKRLHNFEHFIYLRPEVGSSANHYYTSYPYFY